MYRIQLRYKFNHQDSEEYRNIDIKADINNIDSKISEVLKNYLSQIFKLKKHEYFQVWVIDRNPDLTSYQTYYNFTIKGEK